MTPEEMRLVFLWTLFVIIVVWTCLPLLFYWLGLASNTCEADDETSATPDGSDSHYAEIYYQLEALGFTLLSAYRKRVWFYLNYWTKTYRGFYFLSKDRKSYATIYWLNRFDLPRVSFSTHFSDGLLLETANALEDAELRYDGYLRWGLCTRDLGELLSRHEEAVTKQVLTGAQPEPIDGIAAILTVQHRNGYATFEHFRSLGRDVLLQNLTFIALGYWVAGLWVDVGPEALPARLLVGGAICLAFRLFIVVFIRWHRQSELKQAGPPPSERGGG